MINYYNFARSPGTPTLKTGYVYSQSAMNNKYYITENAM